MNQLELARHFGLLVGALLVNALLFTGISLLCREAPVEKSFRSSDPILLTMSSASLSSSATRNDKPMPAPPANLQQIEKLQAWSEPQAAPDLAEDLDIPEVEPPPAPQLLTAVEIPKPAPQVRPKTEKKPRTVSEPRPAAQAPTNASSAEAATNRADAGNGAAENSAGAATGTGSQDFGSREFGSNEVDQAPRVVKQERPAYPLIARRRNLSGKVTVKFLVDQSGRVVKPKILDANPTGIFEESVLESITRWQFKPGRYQGREVATWVVLPIQFRLEGS
jgi:periplasmic protein TonB